MGGYDDHLGIMGDWMLLSPGPSPSPRTFFATLLGEDIGERSLDESATTENKSGLEQSAATVNADNIDNGHVDIRGNQLATSKVLAEQKINARGGLLDRRAARAGFSSPRLNTESIRSPDPSQSQEIRSPYLTIPSGLSPTTLLDSPVFLSNSPVQPSPTTGKFGFGSSSGLVAPNDNTDNCFENINSSFTFKPVEESRSSLFMGATSRPISSSLSQQNFLNIEAAVDSENSHHPLGAPSRVLSQHDTHQQADFSKSTTGKDTGGSNPISSRDQSPPVDDQQDEDVDQRANTDLGVGSGPAEDGYNWRKYGQKQVKGSEYPRSYYKCTHLNCPVKKKVERSHEGHITEIIYKGAHNHPKPPPNRRSSLGSSIAVCDMQINNVEQAGTNVDQNGNGSSLLDWRTENFAVIPSANLGSEYRNGSVSADAVDRSSTFSYDEDEERNTDCVSLGQYGEGEESESKRRKMEAYATEMNGASRAIREPRVVVQTTSEVDILDDGYRWRKYGQKVVKGNPNPRSYYKCTSAKCTVRKHVERASHDLKSVITTYEGKHNHDVPAARNSSHVNSGASNSLSTQATSAVQSLGRRPEPSQINNSMAGFQGHPPLGSYSVPWKSQLGLSHGFGFGMNQQGIGNFAMAGLGQGSGMSVNPFIGQPHHMDDMSFMLPKGEPKLEPISEPSLNSAGLSVYHYQLMNRLSRGSQM
ncbi:DNA-binding transcription factor [Lithospermum erythrorhizon]|uniref:DNA-binding transcription factor n=1 Tax=Lithospermum erythrorhizon TaxID=34254 RepID=A0AAV3R2T9_LITER